tara:strand:+ start:147 stop:482 length:336 start_codon:yes stop_codon:yes gene_type:complete
MDKEDTKKRTIQDLDDSVIEENFKVLGLELARRDLMVNFTVDLNDKEYWIYCGEDTDELEEDELLDYDSSDDEDTYVDDYDDYDDSVSTRTPNDDRSDSMNPNSHRYNPGR